MEILINIDNDTLLKTLKEFYKKNPNINYFVNKLDFVDFENIINELLNIDYDLENLIENIHNGSLYIIDNETELKEIGNENKKIIKINNFYLIIE